MNAPVVSIFQLAAGDLCLGVSLIPAIYADLAEFRESGTLQEVAERITDEIQQFDRHELLAVVDGALVGFACIVEDMDLHVGRCLTLQGQYVVPEYRGKVGALFMRQLVKLGKSQGFKLVAYSHRITQHHYAIKYRSVINEKG